MRSGSAQVTPTEGKYKESTKAKKTVKKKNPDLTLKLSYFFKTARGNG